MADKELLTAGKIAKEFNLPQKKIKEAIKKLNLQPDVKKGNCSYYYRETAEKIKAEVENE